MSFVGYLYDKLSWTTGTLNQGDERGLGGRPATVKAFYADSLFKNVLHLAFSLSLSLFIALSLSLYRFLFGFSVSKFTITYCLGVYYYFVNK